MGQVNLAQVLEVKSRIGPIQVRLSKTLDKKETKTGIGKIIMPSIISENIQRYDIGLQSTSCTEVITGRTKIEIISNLIFLTWPLKFML